MFQNNSDIVMPYFYLYREVTSHQLDRSENTKGGSITVPLTSCSTGLDQSVLQIKAKKLQLSYRWFQTSQTGGQWFSDTSHFSIPWIDTQVRLGSVRLGKVGLGRIEESFIEWVRRKKCWKEITVSCNGVVIRSIQNKRILLPRAPRHWAQRHSA